jgi:NDP-sugar pyrophosphorylase family protein
LWGDLSPFAPPAPLFRCGGLRFAARARREPGPVLALNADELTDLDLRRLLARHEERRLAGTITVVQLPSPFGVVDLDEADVVKGFREAPRLPHWVSCGIYVLGEEALARLPERGDHEQTTFPELAAESKLGAFRHEGVWITVNTPKDLRRARELFGR